MKTLALHYLFGSAAGALAAVGALLACALLRRLRAPSRWLCWVWLAVGLRYAWPGGIPLPVLRAAAPAQAEDAAQGLAQGNAAALAGAAGAAGAGAAPAGAAAALPWYTRLTVWHLLAAVWALGAAALLVRAVWAYGRLRGRVALAYAAADGCYTCAGVAAPFTLGILRPRIYLPDALQGAAREAVLRHERAHIAHGDTVAKPFFYLIVCLHWFDPLAWVAFAQLSRAMECACDEAAVAGLGTDARRGYGEVILRYAAARTPAPACLQFGHGKAKERVEHVLRYRPPRRALLVLCAALALVTAAACAVRPTAAASQPGQAGAPPADSTVHSGVSASSASQAEEPATPAQMAGYFLAPASYSQITRFAVQGHPGDDLRAERGADVVAAADGVVMAAGSAAAPEDTGYGIRVRLEHETPAGTWQSLYAHLEDCTVTPGQTVAAGEVIGHVGATGDATGCFLHFELLGDGLGSLEPRYFTAYPGADAAVWSGAGWPVLPDGPQGVSETEIRQMVWEQLREEDRAGAVGGWQNALVSTLVYDDASMAGLFNADLSAYDGQALWLVVYPSRADSILGDLDVVADPATGTLLACALRD